jgi:hypothetical protein
MIRDLFDTFMLGTLGGFGLVCMLLVLFGGMLLTFAIVANMLGWS